MGASSESTSDRPTQTCYPKAWPTIRCQVTHFTWIKRLVEAPKVGTRSPLYQPKASARPGAKLIRKLCFGGPIPVVNQARLHSNPLGLPCAPKHLAHRSQVQHVPCARIDPHRSSFAFCRFFGRSVTGGPCTLSPRRRLMMLPQHGWNPQTPN